MAKKPPPRDKVKFGLDSDLQVPWHPEAIQDAIQDLLEEYKKGEVQLWIAMRDIMTVTKIGWEVQQQIKARDEVAMRVLGHLITMRGGEPALPRDLVDEAIYFGNMFIAHSRGKPPV
jgi:hypothetical protein